MGVKNYTLIGVQAHPTGGNSYPCPMIRKEPIGKVATRRRARDYIHCLYRYDITHKLKSKQLCIVTKITTVCGFFYFYFVNFLISILQRLISVKLLRRRE